MKIINQLKIQLIYFRQDPLPDDDGRQQSLDARHLLQEREDRTVPHYTGSKPLYQSISQWGCPIQVITPHFDSSSPIISNLPSPSHSLFSRSFTSCLTHSLFSPHSTSHSPFSYPYHIPFPSLPLYPFLLPLLLLLLLLTLLSLFLLLLLLLLSIRVSLIVSCPMHLQLFPMDEQTCHLNVASCREEGWCWQL